MKKRSKNKSFYYIINEEISKGLNLSQIAKKYNTKKQNISYYAKKLRELGYIQMVGKGTWIVKDMPYKVAKRMPYKNIRSHGFVFSLKLPNISNWENRKTYLDKKKIYYKEIGNGRSQSLIIKGYKVWFTDKTITIYFPKNKDYLTDASEKGRNRAIFDFLNLVKHIEGKFNISLKINKNYLFSVSRQHYGYIKNTLAKIYNNPKKRFELYQNRKLWLLIDNSLNLNELETLDPEKAHIDMDKAIKPFFNSMREAPFTAYDFHSLASSVDRVVESQHIWASHIKSHTEAIIELSQLIKELRKINGRDKAS